MNYDDYLYELNAASDDKRERYGDPCPGCHALRWQGDCPNCQEEGLETPAPATALRTSEPAARPRALVSRGWTRFRLYRLTGWGRIASFWFAF